MASVERAQELAQEVLKWLADQPNQDADDIVPALLVAAVKIAVIVHGGEAGLLEKMLTVVGATYRDEIQKYERTAKH